MCFEVNILNKQSNKNVQVRQDNKNGLFLSPQLDVIRMTNIFEML